MAIQRVEATKVTMNQRSQRGSTQLGTVQYSRKDRGQENSHLARSQRPSVDRSGNQISTELPLRQQNNIYCDYFTQEQPRNQTLHIVKLLTKKSSKKSSNSYPYIIVSKT